MKPWEYTPENVPDPYSECEEALIAYLQELTYWFPNDWQVSNNDTNIARGADYFAVLRPGSFPILPDTRSKTGQIVDYEWNVTMDVYVRYTEYEESWGQFKKFRAALIKILGDNPVLQTELQPEKSALNVWGVSLSSDEEAQYFRFDDTDDNQRPNFIIQTMFVVIRQRVEFEF